jgi:hypothetical protein
MSHFSSLVSRVSPDALRRARQVVRLTHMKHYPTEFLTDREADRIIEAIGPESLARAEKLVIDRRLL